MSFYKRNKARYGNFEIVFVARGQSKDEMLAYMKEHDLPFPGLPPGNRRGTSAGGHYGGGFPSLAVVRQDGDLVVNNQIMIAPDCLAEFHKLLKREAR